MVYTAAVFSATRAALGDPVLASIAGAIGIAAVETASYGSALTLGLALAVFGLFAGLGLVIGLVMAVSEMVLARTAWRGWRAAGIRALGALIALVPVSATLFQGASASELPGADSAAIWVPMVGVVVIALAAWLGAALLGGQWRPARALVLVLIAAVTIVIEVVNRRVYRTEYAELHMFLVVVACAMLAVLIRVALRSTAPWSGRIRAVGAVTTLLVLLVTLFYGLASERARWLVATHGEDSRHLSRLVREVLDVDGDGYSSVLGGGDCAAWNAQRSPGVVDVAGNGIDEDCDGVDAEVLVEPAHDLVAQRARSLREIRASREFADLRLGLRGANVLLVSVDALRADMVSGSTNTDSPVLTQLLSESRWFTRAQAPSSGTDVSLSSMLTGRINPFVSVPTTLLESLRASGRATWAVLPSEVLRWAPKTLLTRGLDGYDRVVNDKYQKNIGSYTTSVETSDRGIAFVAGATEPFALWVHYFDVHEHAQVKLDDRHLREVGGEEDLGGVERKYRALLRLTDREIGRLLGALEKRGIAERTIIVFFADHGESLGEDPRLPDKHGLYVYQPLTRIPFAIRAPTVSPARIDEPVSLVDLFPTLSELLSLGDAHTDESDMHGVSLAPLMVASPASEPLYPGRVIVMNESDQWGIIEWPYKLMVRPRENLVELYALDTDPGEKHDLAGAEPQRVRRLKQLYHRFPKVSFDRSRKGRRWRERQGRAPRSRQQREP